MNDAPSKTKSLLRYGGIVVGAYLLGAVLVGIYWSYEPDPFDPATRAAELASERGREPVTGYTTTATLIELARTLLEKRGGYLSNDVMPPSIWLDNTPSWEFGVLVQIRDMSRVMRNDLSRSQSQSAEDPNLAQAEGKFFFDNSSWVFPRSEDEYRDGIRHLESYLDRLSDPQQPGAQFYARSDNLRAWLSNVETRLGSLSQRLAAAIDQQRLDMGLAGDPSASQATATPSEGSVQTPWMEIDNVFYEARGQTWALIHLLLAVEQDFAGVLENKNALVSLRQIIRDLEKTQQTVFSPMILNGDGLGLLANHSLVMASHIARANAAIIDLRSLLSEG